MGSEMCIRDRHYTYIYIHIPGPSFARACVRAALEVARTLARFSSLSVFSGDYQGEIDALTRRSRFSDAAFFGLYKALYEAPDPAPALRHALASGARHASAALEAQKLRDDVAAYDAEFATLKNQDITIRDLQERLAEAHEQLEARLEEAVAEKQRELERAAAARASELEVERDALERRLRGAEDALGEARAKAERTQAQLFDAARHGDERAAGWLSLIHI